MKKLTPQETAYGLFRVALGLNIFLHGLVRLGAPYAQFVEETLKQFARSPLPGFAVESFARAIPVLEVTIGLLVLMGLFSYPSLIAGTLVMIALMAGGCVIQNWGMVGLQMPYILFYAILISGISFNRVSVDRVFFKRERGTTRIG